MLHICLKQAPYDDGLVIPFDIKNLDKRMLLFIIDQLEQKKLIYFPRGNQEKK